MEQSGSVVEDKSFSSSELIIIQWYYCYHNLFFSSTYEVIPGAPGGRLSMIPGRDEILLEGCGCFLVFQGAGKVGKGFLLSRPGQYYYNLRIIGSIFKQVGKNINFY